MLDTTPPQWTRRPPWSPQAQIHRRRKNVGLRYNYRVRLHHEKKPIKISVSRIQNVIQSHVTRRTANTHLGKGLINWFAKKHGLPPRKTIYPKSFTNIAQCGWQFQYPRLIICLHPSPYSEQEWERLACAWFINDIGLEVYQMGIQSVRPNNFFGQCSNANTNYAA